MEKIKLFFKEFYDGFRSFGLMVSTIINFILLMIVYFIGVGLTAIIGKIFKKKFLELKKMDKTYWMSRNPKKLSIKELKRMF